jgi:hypothetical protein
VALRGVVCGDYVARLVSLGKCRGREAYMVGVVGYDDLAVSLLALGLLPLSFSLLALT